jgi:hypothetical protein
MAAEAQGDAISKGRAIYEQRCLHCHGEKADGKGHLIDMEKALQVHAAGLLFMESLHREPVVPVAEKRTRLSQVWKRDMEGGGYLGVCVHETKGWPR